MSSVRKHEARSDERLSIDVHGRCVPCFEGHDDGSGTRHLRQFGVLTRGHCVSAIVCILAIERDKLFALTVLSALKVSRLDVCDSSPVITRDSVGLFFLVNAYGRYSTTSRREGFSQNLSSL